MVTLNSFLIFSAGLKLTNSLDGSLFNFFGALTTGTDWAKQTLFPSWDKTKLSQSLNFPKLFKFSSAFEMLKIKKNITENKIFFYGHGFGYFFWISHIFLIISLFKLIFTLSILFFNCSIVVAPIITEVTNGWI